jgi:hypothetical protein
VAENLNISYDRVGDILYLETTKPYARQQTKHLAPDVLGRCNPDTGDIENIEILFFARKAGGRKGIDLPVLARLRGTRRVKRSVRERTSRSRPRSK